jgi:5-methylcytosine-specific restriction endonuclease McrA
LEKVYKLQLRACFYCRNFRDLEHLTVDHFIPKSAFYVHMTDGGKLWWHVYRGNVVLACMSCNMVKANRHPTEGAIKMYALLFGRPAPTLESLLAYKQEQRQLFGDKRKAPQQ